jgi:hypothetical protein
MVQRRRLNKRLDAPHVRLYRWLLDSPAYLSLSCPAREHMALILLPMCSLLLFSNYNEQ